MPIASYIAIAIFSNIIAISVSCNSCRLPESLKHLYITTINLRQDDARFENGSEVQIVLRLLQHVKKEKQNKKKQKTKQKKNKTPQYFSVYTHKRWRRNKEDAKTSVV